MGIMRVQDKTGDTEIAFDVKDKASIKAAEKVFNDLMAKQHMAYKTDGKGGGEVIRTFDPTAEEIVVAVPLVGG